MEFKLGSQGDILYRELLDLFADLQPAERDALFARLTLALMNAVGDADTIREVFATVSKRD